jgi:inositol 1,4,5-triphosphate receptor type 1
MDSASFEQLNELMINHADLDLTSPLRYHIELVKLMALSTKGKNSTTELKCASFLPMDHIVRVLRSDGCIIEVKSVYLQFMIHCYIDTDIELKDANNAEYLELIMDSILEDINQLNIRLKREARLSHELDSLENYVCQILTEVLSKFFEKPYNRQPLIDIRVSCAYPKMSRQSNFSNIKSVL